MCGWHQLLIEILSKILSISSIWSRSSKLLWLFHAIFTHGWGKSGKKERDKSGGRREGGGMAYDPFMIHTANWRHFNGGEVSTSREFLQCQLFPFLWALRVDFSEMYTVQAIQNHLYILMHISTNLQFYIQTFVAASTLDVCHQSLCPPLISIGCMATPCMWWWTGM